MSARLLPVDSVLAPLLDHFDRHDPGGLVGLYLCGSAVAGGLRPDSDVDLLAVVRSSLSAVERRALVALLLDCSGRWPVVSARPVELTVVLASGLLPHTYPPVCDFRYGEWLRPGLSAGAVPLPYPDRDLVVVVAGARAASRALRGPAFGDVAAPVPPEALRRAVREGLGPLLGHLVGDERNVLLTLARMVVTVESGLIVSKDHAASLVAPGLPPLLAEVLSLARWGYVGGVREEWASLSVRALAAAELLAERVRSSAL